MTGITSEFGTRVPRRFRFRQHLSAFIGIALLLLAARIFGGFDFPMFWPLGAWTVLLAAHFFVATAYEPDDSWIEERIVDLRSRSYDFDHIRSIEKRVEERDASVVPPPERDR